MDGFVYVDERAILGVSLAMRRHHHPGSVKLKELSFPARREASLERLDAPLDDNPSISKKPVERKMRIGGNGLCKASGLGDIGVQHGRVDG
jgi:hypothetical protein